jgi:hypothetical protein
MRIDKNCSIIGKDKVVIGRWRNRFVGNLFQSQGSKSTGRNNITKKLNHILKY